LLSAASLCIVMFSCCLCLTTTGRIKEGPVPDEQFAVAVVP